LVSSLTWHTSHFQPPMASATGNANATNASTENSGVIAHLLVKGDPI